MDALSLDEKIMLVTGKGSWHTNPCDGKLLSIHMSDGPHGLRIPLSDTVNQNNSSKQSTCYPTASAIACSWDRELIGKMATSLGLEARKEGISIVLGPGINIKRSPLCGRNFEYFSEDPYLSGELGVSYVNSMQRLSVGTSLKHFAGNSQETHRQTANSEIDERALREIYLSAFEAVVKQAKPYTIMASYNRINGLYACENHHLLTDLLRKEWEYDGAVISDWGACVNLTNCIRAGMDLEMPASLDIHSKQLKTALVHGDLPITCLDRAVNNIQNLIQKCSNSIVASEGINSSHDHLASPEESSTLIPSHQVAYEAACESAVLLKNDGVLPLTSKSIVIIGDLAKHMRFQGGGSSHINTIPATNTIESLKTLGFSVSYAKGYDRNTDAIDQVLEADAITLAKLGLPILFFGGLTENYEGEGYDRKSLDLPPNQLHLLDKLLENNKNICFISFGGSPMDLHFASKVRGILQMYLAGEAVGEACADLLAGKKNPCGKLAETFPIRISDIPSYSYYGTASDDVEYRESIFVGYRYYDTYHVPVQFCFGHGLSYTTFSYSDLCTYVDNDSSAASNISQYIDNVLHYTGKENLTVSCRVTNTGNVAGKEILQLYVENPSCNYLRAKKELRQFSKVYLEPGESKIIHLTLQEQSFSIFDEKTHKFIMPSGTYLIHLAASINDIRLSIPIKVDGIDYERDDTLCLQEYFQQNGRFFSISKKQFQALYQHPLSDFDHISKGNFTTYDSLKKLSKYSLLGKCSLSIAKQIAYHMFPEKKHDDPEVMMMIRGIEEGTIDSVICQSDGMVPYKLAEAIVLSANGKHLQAMWKLIGG